MSEMQGRRGRPREKDKHARICKQYEELIRQGFRRDVAVRKVAETSCMERDSVRKIVRPAPA